MSKFGIKIQTKEAAFLTPEETFKRYSTYEYQAKSNKSSLWVFCFLNPKQNGFGAATQTKKENKYLSL